jgi:hypothetical protein
MPDTQITAVFCPHQDYKDAAPLASWPVGAGLEIRLTGRTGTSSGTETPLHPADAHGVTSSSVAAGTYGVEVLNTPALWRLAKDELTITPRGDARHVVLVPEHGRQLVPWDLSYEDPVLGSGMLDKVTIHVAGHEFPSDDNGRVNVVAPLGTATASFKDYPKDGRTLLPEREELTFPVSKAKSPAPRKMVYAPDIQLSVEPVVKPLSGTEEPLEGAVVTVDLNGQVLPAKTLEKNQTQVVFDRLDQGSYGITVSPPADGMVLATKLRPIDLQPGDAAEVRVLFEQQNVSGQVQTEDGKLVTQDVQLQISGAGKPIAVTASGGKFAEYVAGRGPLTIGLVPGQELEIAGIPLIPPAEEQQVLLPPEQTVISLPYQHAIKGTAIDEQSQPVPRAKIDIFDAGQSYLATIEAGADGRFVYGVPTKGDYWVAQHLEGEPPAQWDRREVRSNSDGPLRILTRLARSETEATTDLSAYPVLTEEVSTTGPPAPASGGGGGAVGADYGQVVDQAMRDVLGWRPGGDVAGFRSALTGVFQLREVEGHTEWTWQQRGYAVQADMGALTGAQAAIYARAKSALDQILPLLTGLTAIDPALYPPQDLEAIRSVVIAELNELVNEFALEGGPRIARVDELFELLLGESARSANGKVNMDPDLVQGQFGILRDRFGLTVAYVETIDEERIVTNYRIVVEHVLALLASWTGIDRKLLSVVGRDSSLGTVLIWLSRGLEAVTESVSDLTFVMDSVFVDAAQRQVIELKVAGHAPLLLSDLLDWIVRACRDEGPRMIQDSGKDGVTAFAPVLTRLLDIVRRTRDITRSGAPLPPGMRPIPDGLRTPRVHRALQVLVSQLDEAARLAGLVQRDEEPFIAEADAVKPSGSGGSGGIQAPTAAPPRVRFEIRGGNFRRGATVFLALKNNPNVPELTAPAAFKSPSLVHAHFRNTRPGATWLLSLMNEDGTYTNEVEVETPST